MTIPQLIVDIHFHVILQKAEIVYRLIALLSLELRSCETEMREIQVKCRADACQPPHRMHDRCINPELQPVYRVVVYISIINLSVP
jgi:hypothetical protein